MKKLQPVGVFFLAVCHAPLVMAATAFPWDSPLSKLSQNLTGPTSQSLALIGLFVAGGALVFGGDLGDFSKRVTWMTLALSLMLNGAAFVNILANGTALPAAAALIESSGSIK